MFHEYKDIFIFVIFYCQLKKQTFASIFVNAILCKQVKKECELVNYFMLVLVSGCQNKFCSKPSSKSQSENPVTP